jgi:hypothetical protein
MEDLKVKNYKDDARKTFDKMAVKYEKHYYGSQSRIMYKKVALKIEKFKNEFILDLEGCVWSDSFYQRATCSISLDPPSSDERAIPLSH